MDLKVLVISNFDILCQCCHVVVLRCMILTSTVCCTMYMHKFVKSIFISQLQPLLYISM